MDTVLVVFLKKYNPDFDLSSGVKKMLSEALSERLKAGIIIYKSIELNKRWKSKDIKISYDIQKKEKMVLLKLHTTDQSIPEICAIQRVVYDLKKGYHRRDFYITIASDDSSIILSKRLYPLLSSFEINLRRVVYESVIKMNGDQWIDNTISKMSDISDAVKNEMRKHDNRDNIDKLEEEAFDNMTYYHMQSFLFNEYCFAGNQNIWKSDFSEDKLKDKSKEELIRFINDIRPQSMFDILFGDFDELEGFIDALKDIVLIRNTVMHSKHLDYYDYLNAKKLLKKWNEKLISVLSVIEKKEYSEVQQMSLTNYYSSAFRNILELPLSSVKDIANDLVSIGQNFVSIFTSDVLDTLYNSVKSISDVFTPLLLDSNASNLEEKDDKNIKSLNSGVDSKNNDSPDDNRDNDKDDNEKA